MIKNEKGMSLIEVLIALAILGIVAAAFLSGMATASRALIIADERTTAESLARTEMEYVKNCKYTDLPPTPWSYELPSGSPVWDIEHILPAGYDEYSLAVDGSALDADNDGNNDADIQKITVTVDHQNKEVITLVGYKVNR